MSGTNFNDTVLSHWSSFTSVFNESSTVQIDGKSLTVADVVAIAKYGKPLFVTEDAMQKVAAGSKAVRSVMNSGSVIYGINTGFGGSAGTRVKGMEALQNHLITFQQYAIQTPSDHVLRTERTENQSEDLSANLARNAISTDHADLTMSMPESWVKASMLIRLNSLAQGACGVQPSIVQNLASLLRSNIVPIIPLRGSISASGDLSPLSYIAAVLQGRPSSRVWTRNGSQRDQTTARAALAQVSVEPIRLGPKEGLALANGTAVSAAVGSLAAHDCLQLTILSQILTAMTVEALKGNTESFDAFLSEIRPHPGQETTATNIRHFLKGSQLTVISDGSGSAIRQDRYAVRTAPQWVGPVIEDLMLAFQQIHIELNSVTDNPIIDIANERFVHGGNFQARSVTSAMEKIRQGCQSLGRMLFSQCTELINPAMSNGLPPNLAADEPSESYAFKGADIGIAAYQSELGFLANPAGSHVQTAEMGNQSLNSLALISGRYTLEAVTVLSQLVATHLVAACQALDLRAMDVILKSSLEKEFCDSIAATFSTFVSSDVDIAALQQKAWLVFCDKSAQLSTLDSPDRYRGATEAVQSLMFTYIRPEEKTMLALREWTVFWAQHATKSFQDHRENYYRDGSACSYLGSASKKMYSFVREKLQIPFLRTKIQEGWQTDEEGDAITLGEMNTRVYETIRNGAMWPIVIDCMKDVPSGSRLVPSAVDTNETNGSNGSKKVD